MKFDLKKKKLSLSMVIIVILCLVATGIIMITIMKQADASENRPWFFQQSLDTHKPVKLENAYIVSNESGVLEFVHDKESYAVEGNLASEFNGVADILVEEGKITRVYAKPDMESGTLVRYTENNIDIDIDTASDNKVEENTDISAEIDENTDADMNSDVDMVSKQMNRNMSAPVYQVIEGEVKEIEWTSLTVGTSLVKAVMENGQVAALIIEENIVPTYVNVLIRNGDSIYHENNSLEKEYEGEMNVYNEEAGYVFVNKIPVETYLKYVLPSEMPKNFSYEALKAQAVCARTYAYSQMKNGEYAEYGANLDDTTNYQVYNAFGRYAETDAAVEETKGEVILCNDALINCYYFSSSAGTTNDFSVWGDATAEYISMKNVGHAEGLDLSKKEDFSEFIHSTYVTNDSMSPYYRWDVALNIGEIKEASYGKLESVKIIKRNAAGYVTELLMKYEKQNITLTKENDIRKALGLYETKTVLNDGSERQNQSMIPSACFEVTKTSDGEITLRGGGYGHGIGLSQYGANQMAEDGKNYKEIIEYYYSNVKIGGL